MMMIVVLCCYNSFYPIFWFPYKMENSLLSLKTVLVSNRYRWGA